MSALAQAGRMLDAWAVSSVAPTRVGRVISVRGPFLRATGFPWPVGTGALVACAGGDDMRAEVVGFEGNAAVLISLQPDASPTPHAAVRKARSSVDVGVGDALQGRVLDAFGDAADRQGPIFTLTHRDGRGVAQSALARGSINRPFATGVRAIDALISLGRGQRLILSAASGVGKSSLIQQIMRGSQADVVVVALIGERGREITDFVAAIKASGRQRETVTIAVPGNCSPLLRIRGVQRATTIAEYFRDSGQNVLLIVDSLTRVAHAQRELGLGIGETPTMKGYPPSALALIPDLIERCGNDTGSGGSITALYSVLAEGDDQDDPVIDAARAIADGHIVLSRSLAEQGVFPAIDIGRSLSRVMNEIVDPTHKAAAARIRSLWSIAEENRDLALMGAYRSGNDLLVDEALDARPSILRFIKQAQDERIDPEEGIAALIAEFAS